jgi:hypothetical protein
MDVDFAGNESFELDYLDAQGAGGRNTDPIGPGPAQPWSPGPVDTSLGTADPHHTPSGPGGAGSADATLALANSLFKHVPAYKVAAAQQALAARAAPATAPPTKCTGKPLAATAPRAALHTCRLKLFKR